MTISLEKILATRARVVFPYRINFSEILYDNFPLMEEWCIENCSGLWRNHHTYALYWQFDNEQDAMMFMLRWGSAEGNKLK